MSKTLTILPVLVIILSAGLLLSYGHVGSESKNGFFHLTPLDERSKAMISTLDTEWVRSEQEPVFSMVLSTIGQPSVQSLTNVLAHPSRRYGSWHPYSILFPRKAQRANLLTNLKDGMYEAVLVSVKSPSLEVSDDGQLAVMWIGDNTVYIFQDNGGGFSEAKYVSTSPTKSRPGSIPAQ